MPASTSSGAGDRMTMPSNTFSARELARLASYCEAVRAGFYHEGWGCMSPISPFRRI
jgi:hypothetical protein